jgi:hypothetical protein
LNGKAKDNHQLGTEFLVDEGNTSVAKKADIIINIMNYVEMGCRFSDTGVLKATETEENSDRSVGEVKFIGRNREAISGQFNYQLLLP